MNATGKNYNIVLCILPLPPGGTEAEIQMVMSEMIQNAPELPEMDTINSVQYVQQ
jgi:hypothetical protein